MRKLLVPFIIMILAIPTFSATDDGTEDNRPAPASLDEILNPIEVKIEKIRDKVSSQTAFLKDSKLLFQFRTYYFDTTRTSLRRSRAWAIGGYLDYETGVYKNFFSMGATLYTSQKLFGKESEDGTGLLKTNQEGYTVLGQFYGTFSRKKYNATLYRQLMDVTWVNKNDSRMTPNTFEAYLLDGLLTPLQSTHNLNYTVGYVDKMKQRTSEDFVSMSKVADPTTSQKKGLFMGGFFYDPTEDLQISMINHFVEDFLNIYSAQFDTNWHHSEDLTFRLRGFFADQRSVGNHSLTGTKFKTNFLAGRLSGNFHNGILSFAASKTKENKEILNPFGSNPSYLNIMQSDFSRANEEAWLVGLSYVFQTPVLKNFSFFTNYAQGRKAIDSTTKRSLPNTKEIDFTIDYKIEEGKWKDIWLRLRASQIKFSDRTKNHNYRAILNYPFLIRGNE